MKTILLIALFTSCVESTTEDSVLSTCGPRPSYPGAAVAFDGNTATLNRDVWITLDVWHQDVIAWMDCAEER